MHQPTTACVVVCPPLGEENICKTTYQLSTDTGIDSVYIRQIAHSEWIEASWDVLLLISIAMVLDKEQAEQGVEMAGRLLDAGGYKVLRKQS